MCDHGVATVLNQRFTTDQSRTTSQLQHGCKLKREMLKAGLFFFLKTTGAAALYHPKPIFPL
jgi:hypothetical protein